MYFIKQSIKWLFVCFFTLPFKLAIHIRLSPNIERIGHTKLTLTIYPCCDDHNKNSINIQQNI